MRRDMWRHVEEIAPGFTREDPSTWQQWKKRGNYGVFGTAVKDELRASEFTQARVHV